MKKMVSIFTAVALTALFAFAGCEQRQEQQTPEKSAPTSSPTTTPMAPGGK